MSDDSLKYETRFDGRVAVITLNRPERLNAMNPPMLDALDAAWRRFASDDQAWVAVVTGAGDRSFSVGMDLRERAERDAAQVTVRSRVLEYPLSETLNLWKPTIAAINGFAIGGGWRLAQQCDIRIAAEHAQLSI